MVEIGDTGERILKRNGINVNYYCPLKSYEKLFDRVDEIRRGLRKKLTKECPDSLKLKKPYFGKVIKYFSIYPKVI